MALICDIGPLYAAMDRADQDHEVCVRLLTDNREPVVVPAPVLVELEWLAGSRLDPTAFLSILTDVQERTVRVIDLTVADYARIHELCGTYADLPLGFVDAAVLAIVERLGERKLATLDHRHFHVVQPRHISSLVLLPEIDRG